MSQRTDFPRAADRVNTGVRGLDRLLDGGLLPNRAIVVCGSPGTGKTMIALQFVMEGLARGEHGVFLAADEKPHHLLEDARLFGWDLQPALAAGALAVLDASAFFTATHAKGWSRGDVDARRVATELVEQIRTVGARRLVVDSLTSLVPPEMTRGHATDYLRSLIQSLEDNLQCTVMLTCRRARSDPQAVCETSRYLASGIIDLRLVKRGDALVRVLRIRKMRGTRVDLTECYLTIEPGAGLSVVSVSESLARHRAVV